MNVVILSGLLTRDPEVKNVGDATLAKFSVAVKGPKETDFFDVEAWDKNAEGVAKFFKKGDGIIVEGSLKTDKWEKDGQKRSKVMIRLNRWNFPPNGKKAADLAAKDNSPVESEEEAETDGIPF